MQKHGFSCVTLIYVRHRKPCPYNKIICHFTFLRTIHMLNLYVSYLLYQGWGWGGVSVFVRVKPTYDFIEMWGHFPDRCLPRDHVQDNIWTRQSLDIFLTRPQDIFQSWQQSERPWFEMLFQYLLTWKQWIILMRHGDIFHRLLPMREITVREIAPIFVNLKPLDIFMRRQGII